MSEEENIKYKMKSDLFSFDALKKEKDFKVHRLGDAVYLGTIRDEKRNGKGVMIYKNNRVYEGDWVDDLRHGQGFEVYKNGNYYIGGFSNGKINSSL